MNDSVSNSSGTSTPDDLSQRFALDMQGFAALKQSAKASPEQGARIAAKQFDAVFMQMMLKSMREATPSDGLLDSNETRTFTDMLDQQLSQARAALKQREAETDKVATVARSVLMEESPAI